ncbi:hypothetical protein HMPREF0577_0111 [Mobiluncus mulieris ATCC 35243]|nr:hypothetical protein HMPREF0577_0111 [Mobiluncus mulieris ATCC 35243]
MPLTPKPRKTPKDPKTRKPENPGIPANFPAAPSRAGHANHR